MAKTYNRPPKGLKQLEDGYLDTQLDGVRYHQAAHFGDAWTIFWPNGDRRIVGRLYQAVITARNLARRTTVS